MAVITRSSKAGLPVTLLTWSAPAEISASIRWRKTSNSLALMRHPHGRGRDVLAGPIQVQAHHTMPTIWSEGWSGQIAFEPVQRCRPAGTVTVARRLIEELLVQEREQRAVAVGRQRDRH